LHDTEIASIEGSKAHTVSVMLWR